jgi:hypothetical protein
MTKERFCRREPVFKRLNGGVTPVTVSFSLSFQDVPNAGANNCSDTYTQKNYANAARSRTIQESAYGAFQLGGDVLRSSEVPHGTAILLTLSIPAVAFLGVSSLTLTNSAQESRFYLIMMII